MTGPIASDRSRATTSALEGLPVSSDISPKHSPASIVPTRERPVPAPRKTSNLPEINTPKTSPASPARTQTSPG